ncbi:MAG: sulfatase [Thermoanaerobaculia bacterium]
MPERNDGNRGIRRFPAFLLAALALLPLASCRREPVPPRNVIFILVDTLRADHLGTYGYARPTSPNVDGFAREAIKFTAARSQASCTFPSANSILTSRYPSAFLGQADQALGIPKNIPSVAEILREHGFRTAAVSASPVVRVTPSRYNPSAGFGRGFDVFEEGCMMRPASCVNRRAAELLQRTDKPLFLYLHYMDPHGPYQPPRHWKRRFATGRPEKKWVRIGDPNPIGDWLYAGKKRPVFTPADLRHLVDLYDEEIAFFDDNFADLVATLRKGGWLDDSLVILVSDHGEEFLEHEHLKHCRALYDSSIHVPMLLRIPGVDAGAVAAPVQNVDLVPTILDYMGIDAGKRRFEGRSLRPLVEGKAGPAQPAPGMQYGLQATLRSASDGRYKLIQDLEANRARLYDLQADPKENRDVLAGERRSFFRLRDALATWLARTEGGQGESVRKAKESEQRLRSLGYIQ